MRQRSQSLTNINRFLFKQQIGKGKFGTVYLATFRQSQLDVAIKTISKNTISKPTLYQQMKKEIQIQSKLKHQNISQLYYYFHDENNIYLVMQYCPGFNLFDLIKKQHKLFTEKEIAIILMQLLCAIAFIRQRNIIHRDLKLENIIIDSNLNVKLIDFGWCIETLGKQKAFCGTMEYICPQMIEEVQYGHSIDLYCLGIILYELFYHTSPYIGQTQQQTFLKIKQGKLNFLDDLRIIPQSAKDLIRRLVSKNENERSQAKYLFNDPFIKQYLQY